ISDARPAQPLPGDVRCRRARAFFLLTIGCSGKLHVPIEIAVPAQVLVRMSASFDTLLRLAALTRSASEDDLRELDRELDELDVGDRRLLFLAWRLFQGEAVEVSANTQNVTPRSARLLGTSARASRRSRARSPARGFSFSDRPRRSDAVARSGTARSRRQCRPSRGAGWSRPCCRTSCSGRVAVAGRSTHRHPTG